jgi:hypothetical protein
VARQATSVLLHLITLYCGACSISGATEEDRRRRPPRTTQACPPGTRPRLPTAKLKAGRTPSRFRHAHVRVRKSEIDRTLCLAPKSCRTTTTGSGSYEEDGRAGTAPWTLGAVLRSVVAGAPPARRFNPRGTEFQGRRAPRSSLHQRQSAAEGPVIDASSSSSVRHCSLWQLMVRTGSIED